MGQSGRKPWRLRRDRQVAAAFSLQKGQGLERGGSGQKEGLNQFCSWLYEHVTKRVPNHPRQGTCSLLRLEVHSEGFTMHKLLETFP